MYVLHKLCYTAWWMFALDLVINCSFILYVFVYFYTLSWMQNHVTRAMFLQGGSRENLCGRHYCKTSTLLCSFNKHTNSNWDDNDWKIRVQIWNCSWDFIACSCTAARLNGLLLTIYYYNGTLFGGGGAAEASQESFHLGSYHNIWYSLILLLLLFQVMCTVFICCVQFTYIRLQRNSLKNTK